MIRSALALLLLAAAPAGAQPVFAPAPAPAKVWPGQTEGDFTVKHFRFQTGEILADLRLHYMTLGTPRRNRAGEIDNAVMVLHGTGGTGQQFLRPQFADELYGPGQPLDLAKFYVILPDSIGHGKSSKPSDGLRMEFPKYDYQDMVAAQHALLAGGLKVKRLRLLMGTSMGCMHDFVWGTTYPGFARAIMPTACQPVQIAGRNRMWRKMSIDAIMADPAWMGGNYTAQPAAGLRTAAVLSAMAGSAPARQQADYPTRAAAETAIAGAIERAVADGDANDIIYRLDSSRTYDPSGKLGLITVPVTWINSADDFINPPGLGIAEAMVGRMPNAIFRMVPETPDGRGHSTHTWAKFWKDDLVALLKRSE